MKTQMNFKLGLIQIQILIVLMKKHIHTKNKTSCGWLDNNSKFECVSLRKNLPISWFLELLKFMYLLLVVLPSVSQSPET